jgi:hypothetical protein
MGCLRSIFDVHGPRRIAGAVGYREDGAPSLARRCVRVGCPRVAHGGGGDSGCPGLEVGRPPFVRHRWNAGPPSRMCWDAAARCVGAGACSSVPRHRNAASSGARATGRPCGGSSSQATSLAWWPSWTASRPAGARWGRARSIRGWRVRRSHAGSTIRPCGRWCVSTSFRNTGASACGTARQGRPPPRRRSRRTDPRGLSRGRHPRTGAAGPRLPRNGLAPAVLRLRRGRSPCARPADHAGRSLRPRRNGAAECRPRRVKGRRPYVAIAERLHAGPGAAAEAR